jgi:hypothetical protein
MIGSPNSSFCESIMDVELVNNHESLDEVVSCLVLALGLDSLVRWRALLPIE